MECTGKKVASARMGS